MTIDRGEINAPCLNVQLFCANFPKPNHGSFEFIHIFSGELGLIRFFDRVIKLFIPELRIVKFPENRGPMRGGGGTGVRGREPSWQTAVPMTRGPWES